MIMLISIFDTYKLIIVNIKLNKGIKLLLVYLHKYREITLYSNLTDF